ncbi:hypothetical protein BH23ACT9_BH23ACT9_34780 [soil metagenome]
MKVVTHRAELEAAGGTAVFVVFDEPDTIRRMMLKDVDSPFPVLVDTERVAYRAWGLRRASFREIWLDPNVWRTYGKLLRAGERFSGLGADVRQFGGDFIVDSDGLIRYARPQQRDDRPPVGQLLKILREG